MGSFFITHVPPIIYYLCGFILGISFHNHSLLLIPLCMAIGLLTFFKYRIHLIIWVCGMVAFGCVAHNGYALLYEKAAAQIPTTPIMITGVVTDIQKTNHRIFKNLVVLSLNSINGTSTSWFNPHHKIHIYVSSYPSVEVDDVITLENVQCKKPPQSSYRGHLMREQTIATIFTPKIVPSYHSKPTFSYKRWIYNTKILVTKRATQSLIPVAKSLYASLFLGNKTYTSSCYESIKEQFRRWGLSHYLARSGAYVYLNRKVSPQAASSYAYVNPLVAVLLGWGFLGESVTATILVAGALIVIAVAVLLAGGRRPSASGAEATCMEGGQPEVA